MKLHLVRGLPTGLHSGGYWAVREIPSVKICRLHDANDPGARARPWVFVPLRLAEGYQIDSVLEAQEFRTRTEALEVLQLAYDLSLSEAS